MIFDHSTSLGVALFGAAAYYLVSGNANDAVKCACGAIVFGYGYNLVCGFWRARTGV